MLKRLSLYNFQCHENLEIDLDEHITVVVGPSDVGKSAILRALYWLCFNRPTGTGFLRQGSSGVRVVVHASRDEIARVRRRDTNAYELRGKVYQALGTSVPDDISRNLNVSPEQFQLQHQPPFWLTDSPGQVARNLNAVVDLALMDCTLDNLNKRLRKAKTTVEVSQERLTSCQEKLAELDWVEEADRKLKVLEALEGELSQKRSEASQIASLLAKAQELRRGLRNVQEKQLEAGKLVSCARELLACQDRHQKLQKLLMRWTAWGSQEAKLKEGLKEARAGLDRIQGTLCPVCGNPVRTLLPSLRPTGT